jgi:formylglycine-generating enzyme required for sulfatase activity
VLLISDSCFAGAFFKGKRGNPPEITDAYIRSAFKKSSRQAITSGGMEPVVDVGFDGHSVFAYFLLKELNENSSPFLLPSDLHNRIKGGVSLNAKQQAILGDLKDTGAEVGGEFVLFRKGAGGTMEALLKRKAERLERLAAMEAEAHRASAAARKLEAQKQAELDALDAKIKALEAKVGNDSGGGTLKELLALVEQQERQGKALEELKRKKAAEEAERRAEIARLKKAESEKRKKAFEADYADYQRILGSKYARPAIKQKAWEAICRAWGVGFEQRSPKGNWLTERKQRSGNVTKGTKVGALRWNDALGRAEMTDVGSLVVRSKKAGKVRLGDGSWNALEAGEGLQWNSLPVGEYRVEAVIAGKPWNKTVTVRDEQTSEVAVAFGPANGESWKSPSTGMEFVWIKALDMWVGKYEVTNGEYCKKEPEHSSKDYNGHSLNGDRQPVVYVNFDDAKAYAEWLTKRDRASGSLPAGYRYRLPSDDEFLSFVQCGDGREYPWGNNWPPRSGQAGNYADSTAENTFSGWTGIDDYRDGHAVTCDVEDSWDNPWGLYGVGGNVWECCAKSKSGSAFGAWRGASWRCNYRDRLRCSYRIDRLGSIRVSTYGFRLVLSR